MVGTLWAICENVVETDFSKCMNYTPYNNLVFMGNPSKNPPPEPMNLNASGYTYNGTTTFDYVHHFAYGLAGKNNLVVVLLRNEVYLLMITKQECYGPGPRLGKMRAGVQHVKND
jgi:hypothetical protein